MKQALLSDLVKSLKQAASDPGADWRERLT